MHICAFWKRVGRCSRPHRAQSLTIAALQILQKNHAEKSQAGKWESWRKSRLEMDATGRCGYTGRSLDINYLSERQLMSSNYGKSGRTRWINR